MLIKHFRAFILLLLLLTWWVQCRVSSPEIISLPWDEIERLWNRSCWLFSTLEALFQSRCSLGLLIVFCESPLFIWISCHLSRLLALSIVLLRRFSILHTVINNHTLSRLLSHNSVIILGTIVIEALSRLLIPSLGVIGIDFLLNLHDLSRWFRSFEAFPWIIESMTCSIICEADLLVALASILWWCSVPSKQLSVQSRAILTSKLFCQLERRVLLEVWWRLAQPIDRVVWRVNQVLSAWAHCLGSLWILQDLDLTLACECADRGRRLLWSKVVDQIWWAVVVAAWLHLIVAIAWFLLLLCT